MCFNTGVQTPWKWQSSAKTWRNNLITLLFYIYYLYVCWLYESSVMMHGMNDVKTHLIYCVIELVHPAWSHHIAVFIMSIHSFHPLTDPRGGSDYSVFLLLLSWTSQLSQEVPEVAGILCKKAIMLSRTTKERACTPQCSKIYFFIFEHIHHILQLKHYM